MPQTKEETVKNITFATMKRKTPKKLHKFRFLSAAYLQNIRREQIILYIISLHKKIRLLLKKSKKYKETIVKLKRTYKSNVENENGEDDDEDGREEATANLDPGATNFIAEIKDAAHEAQHGTGFIYEPTSGLYYDSRTGYYYNAEHGLYYDGNNGCYYSYNQAENKFEFHSQVYANEEDTTKQEQVCDDDSLLEQFSHLALVEQYREQDNQLTEKSKRKRRRKSSETIVKSKDKYDSRRRRPHQSKKKSSDSDLEKEDGECSDQDDSDSSDDYGAHRKYSKSIVNRDKSTIIVIDDDTDSSEQSGSGQESYSDIAKKYPPSLRIIVQETNIKRLRIGELFLITYKGGSLGREGKHDVIIPDINCSKFHLKFEYDMEKRLYFCTDVGSRNGTIMNGKRMSITKQKSDALRLDHGTNLQIGQTKLLCHIHDGHTTCGQCEPGLVENDSSSMGETASTAKPHADVSAEHKRQLKNLKKRYGLQDEKYTAPKLDAKNDRAEQRRQKVGSSCDHEKTKAASLNTSISNENKGFKMLKSLGWSEGQALGKNQDGLLEPIPLQGNQDNKGLGCEGSLSSVNFDNNAKQKHKSKIWEKTNKRYHESNQKAVDIFKDDESD